MGIYDDCKKVVNDKPPSTLTALEREVLYARIRAFSVRVQYLIWNIAATVLLYLFNKSLLNEYIWNGEFYKIITFHVIQSIAIISYFATSLSDPGILYCYIHTLLYLPSYIDHVFIVYNNKNQDISN